VLCIFTQLSSPFLKLRPCQWQVKACQLTLHKQDGSFHDPALLASHAPSEECRTQWRSCTTVNVTYQVRCLPNLESFPSKALQKSMSNPLERDQNIVGHANNVERISYAGRVGHWNQHNGSTMLHISALSPLLMFYTSTDHRPGATRNILIVSRGANRAISPSVFCKAAAIACSRIFLSRGSEERR
jgi:hypothetical protein